MKKGAIVVSIIVFSSLFLTGCGEAINKTGNETGKKILDGTNSMLDEANENNSKKNKRIEDELDSLGMGSEQ